MHAEQQNPRANPWPRTPLDPDALPDREARSPYLHHLLHVGLPVFLSIAIHLGILLFLGFKTFEVMRRPTPEVGTYTATLTEQPADAETAALDWTEQTPPEIPLDFAPAEQPLNNLTAFPADNPADLSALHDPSADRPASGFGGQGEGLGVGGGALGLLGTGSGSGEPGTGGFGTGFGRSDTGIGQAGIWNLRIRANRVAYVVDFSGSIIVAVGDLKRELKRSIGRLKPTQSFNVVIFYSAGAGLDEQVRTESFRPQLEPATPALRRQFFEWIDRKAPRGQTEPLAAMQRALALDPDAVFFFSDGYFDDRVVDEITAANRQPGARIYCLVFDELLLQDVSGLPRATEGAERLRRIAEANHGRMKIVTGADLGGR